MMTIKNAVIERAKFDMESGLLSAWVFLDFGGSGQGFGGYALYLPSEFKHGSEAGNIAGHFIYRVLQVAGADDWSRLPGRTVRARGDRGQIQAIGHIIKEDWFDPAVEFAALKVKATNAVLSEVRS